MKFLRFQHGEVDRWGFVTGNEVAVLRGDPFHGLDESGERLPLPEVRVLAPVQPGKIIAAGLNYTDHAAELGMELPSEPVIFYKAPSSVIGPEEKVVIPKVSHRVDYEAELAVVMRKPAYRVSEAEALDYVLGYTCLNDVTARDLQQQDGQWTRAKSFNTFCPVGPWIVNGIDPDHQQIELYVNDEVKQFSNTENLIFKTATLIAFISGIMPLHPGDVISTGTPPGVGALQAGDRVEVVIGEIGRLVNTVIHETEEDEENEEEV